MRYWRLVWSSHVTQHPCKYFLSFKKLQGYQRWVFVCIILTPAAAPALPQVGAIDCVGDTHHLPTHLHLLTLHSKFQKNQRETNEYAETTSILHQYRSNRSFLPAMIPASYKTAGVAASPFIYQQA